jgi:hypothetical protein
VRLRMLFCAMLLLPCGYGALRKHALVIGIDTGGLHYAGKDAEAFATYIESPQGGSFPHTRIKLLTGSGADRTAIFKAIAAVGYSVEQDRSTFPDDTSLVYVFISGHSAVDRNTEESYIMPAGSEPSVPTTGIRSDDFLKQVKTSITADRIIYFLDTCHAAASQNEGSTSKGYKRINTLDARWELYFKGAKTRHIGFFSSSANEESYEDSELQQGIFTHYLLKGLRGQADLPPTGDGNGEVTADELRAYLEKYVPAKAKSHGSQTPKTSLIWDGATPLTRVPLEVELEIYSSGAPADCLDRIRKFRGDGEVIKSLSLSADGRWVIITDKHYLMSDQATHGEVAEFRKAYPNASLLVASLADSGQFALAFDEGYRVRAPAAVLTAVQQIYKPENTIEDLYFDQTGRFVIIYNQYGYSSSGMSESFLKKLQEINTAKLRIKHVALGPNDSWGIIYESGWWTLGFPEAMNEVLWSLWERQRPVAAWAINPQTGAWVVIGEREPNTSPVRRLRRSIAP